MRSRGSARATVVLASLALSVALVSAETVIHAPPNRYTPAQDVELGRRAAAEVRQQLPMINDARVTSYVTAIGRRLVAAIPGELRHRGFQYSFQVANARAVNAFALPGGPMFVNRGMIEAAQNEGQLAGVMAHELSHIILRHGTAQASKATKYELGQIAGSVLGAIIGGRVGSVVAQGTRFGLGTAFMRFSRQFEREADLEGSHLMARAGYDPRDMAGMFRVIAQRGGSGGPEWLSDHPNPGNRYDYITREARMLRVSGRRHDTGNLRDVQIRLRGLPSAPSRQMSRR